MRGKALIDRLRSPMSEECSRTDNKRQYRPLRITDFLCLGRTNSRRREFQFGATQEGILDGGLRHVAQQLGHVQIMSFRE